jgi:phosphoribosylformylglycinamidine synthase
MSEGGLAVAAAEMAFAGGLGVRADVTACPHQLEGVEASQRTTALLFAESNTRLLCEVPVAQQKAFESLLQEHSVAFADIGVVEDTGQVILQSPKEDGSMHDLVTLPIGQLKEAWQAPLRW